MLDEYSKFKQEGKVRFIGASVKGPGVTSATQALARQYIDSGRVDVLQMVYSILRQKNLEVFQYAQKNGVGIVARTALESGFLGGKYRPGHVFTDGHRALYPTETQKLLLDSMEMIEGRAVKPPYESVAQVAVKFSTLPDSISSLILGARTAGQIKQLTNTINLPELDPELVNWLVTEFGGKTESMNPGDQKPAMLDNKKV